jgi:hypothetical protein
MESRFVLDDKTVVIVRPLLADVRRAKNRFNKEGDPIYFMKIGFVVSTRVPTNLRKKQRRTRRARRGHGSAT